MKSTRLTSGATLFGQEYNALRSDAVAASWLHAHQMLGTFAMPTNPTNGQAFTFTINSTGVTLTAKTSPVNPGDFKIQGSAALTGAVVAAALQNITVTSSNFVGLNTTGTAANAILLQYPAYAYVAGATSIIVYSLNNSTYAPLTSFTASTTITSASWTANTMALYVEPGTYFLNGIRYFFLGGVTGTVTAPVSHPRIDELSIDNTGTLNWTTGSENASPVAPTYAENQVPLCELYNVVSETALYDNDNQQSGQGYVYNDVRPAIGSMPSLAAWSADTIPDTTNTRSLGSGSYQFLNVYAQSVYQNGNLAAAARFGGTGTDGALTITSGTTTLSFASAQILVKNYSSISITGTGALTFSNPNAAGSCALIKCVGVCTITSSATAAIYVDGMGAPGGAGAVSSLAASSPGSNATLGWYKSNGATVASYSTHAAGTSTNGAMNMYTQSKYLQKYYPFVFAGGGGSGGQFDGTGSASAGGYGGGALVMEVAGSLNFTGTITANGLAGGAASGTIQAAGGGGGGGGSIVILYNAQTAISGTLTANGGANTTGTGVGTDGAMDGGATPFSAGTGGAGNSGGAGQTLLALNTEFS